MQRKCQNLQPEAIFPSTRFPGAVARIKMLVARLVARNISFVAALLEGSCSNGCGKHVSRFLLTNVGCTFSHSIECNELEKDGQITPHGPLNSPLFRALVPRAPARVGRVGSDLALTRHGSAGYAHNYLTTLSRKTDDLPIVWFSRCIGTKLVSACWQ